MLSTLQLNLCTKRWYGKLGSYSLWFCFVCFFQLFSIIFLFVAKGYRVCGVGRVFGLWNCFGNVKTQDRNVHTSWLRFWFTWSAYFLDGNSFCGVSPVPILNYMGEISNKKLVTENTKQHKNCIDSIWFSSNPRL